MIIAVDEQLDQAPEITEQQLDQAFEYSMDIVDKILEDQDKVETGAVMYNLFKEGIEALQAFGWTREELIQEINASFNHIEH